MTKIHYGQLLRFSEKVVNKIDNQKSRQHVLAEKLVFHLIGKTNYDVVKVIRKNYLIGVHVRPAENLGMKLIEQLVPLVAGGRLLQVECQQNARHKLVVNYLLCWPFCMFAGLYAV